MVVIGLTGQSGAGKSTVCRMLEQRGCAVLDCDRIARSVTEKGSVCLKELCRAFGADILEENGELNRRKLAGRAFSSRDSHSACVCQSQGINLVSGQGKTPLSSSESHGACSSVIEPSKLSSSLRDAPRRRSSRAAQPEPMVLGARPLGDSEDSASSS